MKTPAGSVVLLTALMWLAIGCFGGSLPSGSGGDTEATAVPPAATPNAPSAPDATTEAPHGADTVVVPAEVLAVQIDVAESDPPQYFARVTSGLSNSCVEHEGYELTHEGSSIGIKVYSREPSPAAQIMCAEIYLEHETSVPLGSHFESGREYTVDANGKAATFVAQ